MQAPLNAAQKIIEKFGGQSAVAKLIGKGQSTVQHWCKSGVIPAKWQSVLLGLARDESINISASDFVKVPEVDVNSDDTPVADWAGVLEIGAGELPCYVLNNGMRVISRTGATKMLAGPKGGGQLEKYAAAGSLPKYIPNLADKMMDFTLAGVVNKTVRGMSSDAFLEVCEGYVRAWMDGALDTESQKEMAKNANIFLAGCTRVGLAALIDEATGYQYDRAEDALRVKLKAFIAEDMRKWEKTFPDDLWHEFARLTNRKGPIHSRPKYWGKLVIELIYDYLDPDVSKWLKDHAPSPQKGQSYHQWLTGQYGLRKLTEHIWMVIGMARGCKTMEELRAKRAEATGRQRITVTVYVKPTNPNQPTLFDDDIPGEELSEK